MFEFCVIEFNETKRVNMIVVENLTGPSKSLFGKMLPPPEHHISGNYQCR